MTFKQWKNNEKIEQKHPLYSSREPVELVGYETFEFPAKEILEITDNHFESAETYAAALEIIRRINDVEKMTEEYQFLRKIYNESCDAAEMKGDDDYHSLPAVVKKIVEENEKLKKEAQKLRENQQVKIAKIHDGYVGENYVGDGN